MKIEDIRATTKATTTGQETCNSAPLLDVGRGNNPLKPDFMEAISDIIDSGRFIGGQYVQQLESLVAQAAGAEFGIGCASGSDALLLALMAVGIEAGDEVICPSFTFFATASAIHRLGGVPVFVDIEPDYFNLDYTQLESVVTSKTKAIIPVHLFGQCCEMDPILDFAKSHDLKVIEDCAQSIGATYSDRLAGGMGDVGCFSFYPTKNIGGFGDGGMLTTNDPEIADRLRLFANHGMRPRYHHQVVGINSRLDAIQAAVLCHKMEHLNDYSSARGANATNYRKLMLESGLQSQVKLPSTSPNCGHVWNQFTIRIPDGRRDEVRMQLAEMNVGSEVYYPIPLHQQECFQHLDVDANTLRETELAASEVLSIPIFPELTRSEQEYVVNCLAEVLGESGFGGLRMVG